MITPDIVIAAVLVKLQANKTDIGITDAVELSEDSGNIELTPPYAVVYEDFNETADTDNSGKPCNIPTDIVIGASSAPKKTVSESSAEAYRIAVNILNLIPGYYKLKNSSGDYESVMLRCKPKPIQVGSKSAEQTGILVFLEYSINIIP